MKLNIGLFGKNSTHNPFVDNIRPREKSGKIPSLVLAVLVIFVVCACEIENPWMKEIWQYKTITFNTNGGSYVPSQELIRGERVTRPSNPYKANSVFQGWYKDNGTFKEPYDFSYIPKQDMTLHAKWDDGTGGGTTVIENVNVMVSNPSTGNTQTTTATGGTGYICGAVTWEPIGDKFIGNTVYSAAVEVSANNGYKFTSNTTAFINGHVAVLNYIDEKTVIVKHTFAKTTTAMITGISITSQPTRMTYTHGDNLSLDGLEVTLTYDDGDTENVPYYVFDEKNIATNPPNGAILSRSEHNDKYVEVSISSSIKANTTYTLTVNKATPVAADFNIDNLTQTANNITPVTITPKAGKSDGTITIYYGTANPPTTTLPTTVGSYTVTFNVGASTDGNWYAAANLQAGTLTINNPTFDNLDELQTWLDAQPNNTADGALPYTVKLNVNDLSGIKQVLNLSTQSGKDDRYAIKFVDIDLSGSNTNNIPAYAFSYIYSLTGITIPNSVTSIGDFAFSSCKSLTSVTIPDSVTSIGDGAFWGCTSLTSVNIPNNVTRIGDNTFYCCTSLTSVTIPQGVTSIGNNAFAGCSSLTGISIPSSVTSIGESAFWGCTSLTSVNIPAGVTSIESEVFFMCTSLTSVTIPASVNSIGYNAFSYCTSLTSVTIPSSVTNIGDFAFVGCDSLTSVTFAGIVTSFGPNPAFDGNLQTTYLGASGGPGTYNRTGSGTSAAPYVWTKQTTTP